MSSATRCFTRNGRWQVEIAEVEVESVAFIVCDALGLDSGEYSFPYVQG